MATTVHEPPGVDERQDRSPKISSGNGNGWRNLVPADGNLKAVEDYAPPPASTGIWVAIAAISMTFAALTSALIVRKAGATWRHFELPSILLLNTVVLLASSVTLELARRRVATFMGGLRTAAARPATWLYATLGLGLLFVAGQYAAWRQLNAEGLYLATNPSSSFFYVFTAGHALHVLGGLGGLVRVVHKLNQRTLLRSTLDATSRYWHFMDVLWIYLLLLLWIKL
jgi:cytochrome c oxidase subunit 3